MNYENCPCPGCEKPLHEDEDIVVCPDCGTPQHRSCWMENGRCVNSARHAEGYRWSPVISGVDDDDAFVIPDEVPDEKFGEKPRETVVCAVCGSENLADLQYCARCGAALYEEEEKTVKCIYCGSVNTASHEHCDHCGAPLTMQARDYRNPFIERTGMDENEIIAGRTAGDFALYIRMSAAKYLRKFKQIESGKKTFNWAAFFFGPFWFFARKMYKQGIMIFSVIAAASLVYLTALEKVQKILLPYQEQILNQTMPGDKLMNLMGEMWQILRLPFAIVFGVVLIVNIISAFAANREYMKKILVDLRVIDEQMFDTKVRAMVINRRGGLSVLSAILGYFTYTFIESILLHIAQFAAERF